MKLTDKRFGIFEFMMLLCGILTTCIEALNYGISLFDLMGHLLVFPLCFCMGGIATWKIIKRSRVWLLSGFSLLFSFIAYNLFHLILYPIYGVSFASVVFWEAAFYFILFSIFFGEAAFYFILFSIFPVIICSLAYRWIEKHYIR